MAVMDISGEVEEKPYVKKAAAQYPVIKETIAPAPGFPDQVVGMNKEDKREFDLDFPADYPNKNVAGKKGHFTVTLHEVKEEKLPEVNEDFVKQISTDFKTVEELRQEAAKSLKLRGEENSRMDFEERVINAVIEGSKVAYPPVLVEMEVSRIINEQARQLQVSGRGMDDYLKMVNKTVEQLQEELRPVATKNVTASLVLGRVAEAEKIEVTAEDIENGIKNMVRNAAEDRREGMRRLLDTPQARESLRQSLLTRKTIERLTEIAKSTEISENIDKSEKLGTAEKKPKEEKNDE
jgi:trigger factor